jgi:hypothetical protein
MDMLESNNKSIRKSRAEKILDDIEVHLRQLIKEKKEIKKGFVTKLKEIEKQNKDNQEWFEDNWREAERIENKLILLWDYWSREVEILALERKMQSGVMPSEREKIMGEIKKLNSLNITLEQGFKKRKIDAEVVETLRKRLGVWEGDKKE